MNIAIGIIAGFALLALLYWALVNDCLGFICFCLAIVIGVSSCNRSDWYAEHSRKVEIENARTEAYNATPHVIREADGCKVYTFEAGDKWHYFTRCQANTVTESHHNESCGKNKTCDVAESITVEMVGRK